MVLAVAGNVRHGEVAEAAARWLGELAPVEPGPWFPAVARNGAPRLSVKEKATEQAHLCFAFPGVPLGSEERFAVSLLSMLLGEGMSSRLFLELREERALVYDIHSYTSEYRDAGALTIYAGCDPENARVTAEATLEETLKLLEGVPPAELQKAKEMAKGRIQLRMEDTRAVAGWMGSQELLRGEVLSVDEAVARFDAVTIDELVAVGRRVLDPAAAVLAAVGPLDAATFEGIL